MRGYTLVELLVALLIFGIVITSVVAIVVSAVKSSRKSAAVQNIEDNSRAVFESIVREVRTGSDFILRGNGRRFCFSSSGTSASPEAYIRYRENNGFVYRRSILILDSDHTNCSGSGSNESQITSDDVIVNNLEFVVNPSGGNSQKMVTIFMEIASADEPTLESIQLQTTVSSRSYR